MILFDKQPGTTDLLQLDFGREERCVYFKFNNSNNFDLLRLILALLVIYSHSYILGTGFGANEPLSAMTHGQVDWGAIAVDGFFFISGYLITSSYERSKSLFNYLRKRIFRIYPGFIGATLFDIFVVLPLSSGHLAAGSFTHEFALQGLKTTALEGFDFTGAFPSNPFPGVINGSLWTIRPEFLCYLGLALLGLCGALRRRRLTSLLLLFLLLLAIPLTALGPNLARHFGAIGFERGRYYSDLFGRLVPMYLAGVVTYLYSDKLTLRLSYAIGAFAVILASLWIPYTYLISIPLAGGYLLMYLAYSPWIRFHHFARYGDSKRPEFPS